MALKGDTIIPEPEKFSEHFYQKKISKPVFLFLETREKIKGCLEDWTSPSEDNEFCYKVFQTENEETNNLKTVWANAKQQVLFQL